MLTIKLTDINNLELKMPEEKEYFVYEALNGNNRLGLIVFNFDKNNCNIAKIELADENDKYLLDGLIRAAANFSENKGMTKLIFLDKKYNKKILNQDILINDEIIISEIFKNCKKCK